MVSLLRSLPPPQGGRWIALITLARQGEGGRAAATHPSQSPAARLLQPSFLGLSGPPGVGASPPRCCQGFHSKGLLLLSSLWPLTAACEGEMAGSVCR